MKSSQSFDIKIRLTGKNEKHQEAMKSNNLTRDAEIKNWGNSDRKTKLSSKL